VSPLRLDAALIARVYATSRAAAWGLTEERFRDAIQTSAAKAFAGREPAPPEIERYVHSLHLEDLALAAACAAGADLAWDHFVREYRPVLYRAADAIDPSGSARELADSLYAELYGLRRADRDAASLFRYFHGRSSLGTWLRAILSQRFIDAKRASRRLDPIEETEVRAPSSRVPEDPGAAGRVEALRQALAAALAALSARDRLRLALYYVHEMTLAAIGRQFGEHEATASRQLARTRRILKADVERRLRADHEFDGRAIAECWRSAMDDAGPLDLAALVGADGKNAAADRSTEKEGV
jgi:RNA polymerase sigma-70 factor